MGKPLTIERTLHGLDSAYTTVLLAHSQHCGLLDPANICLSMTRFDSTRAYARRKAAARGPGTLIGCIAKWDYVENVTMRDAKLQNHGQIPIAPLVP